MGTVLMITILLQLLSPLVLRYVIDSAITGEQFGILLLGTIVFVCVALAEQTFRVVASNLGTKVSWTATNSLRMDLTRHSLELDMSFHNNHMPGEMIERIDGDSNTLGGFLSTFIVEILGNILLLSGILVVLFFEDWRIGTVLIAFCLLALGLILRLRDISVPHWQAASRARAESFGFIEETIGGNEDLHSSGARPYATMKFDKHLRKWFGEQMRANLMTALVANSIELLFTLVEVLGLAVAAYLFIQGSITIGTVYLVFHYTSMTQQPITRLVSEMGGLQIASGSIQRIRELLFETRSQIKDGPGVIFPAGPLAVSFHDVGFSYDKDTPTLRNVSFELQPGRKLGLLGRTGSGKTSVARLLLRLYDLDRGVVRVGGKDISESRISDLRSRVGIVTQDVRLFHGSIRDNITLFDPNVSDGRLIAAMSDLGLGSWYSSLPDGLDTEVGSGGSGLSAGEAQLVALTRVLLHDYSLLVLDEATSRLDPSTERLTQQAIEMLLNDRTTIVIAHHLATVQEVDDILILEEGEVSERGIREQLAGDPESRFRALLQKGMLEEYLV